MKRILMALLVLGTMATIQADYEYVADEPRRTTYFRDNRDEGGFARIFKAPFRAAGDIVEGTGDVLTGNP